MKIQKSDPKASALMESTRSIGYNFNSAIADIIDNSIAKKANNIWIYSPPDKIQISILDDGQGMSRDTLLEAMRYGSDPNAQRDSDDLGRFGLGLKVASLSQCRQLTVISKKGGTITAVRWDLDFVIEQNEWLLQELDPEEYDDSPQLSQLNNLPSGTLVIWSNMDKLVGKSSDEHVILIDYLTGAISNIGLVFHRFMDSDSTNPVHIYMNGAAIEPADPFLIHHTTEPKTQKRPEMIQQIDGHEVIIKPYILPPLNKLTAEQRRYLGSTGDLLNTQGFYVYRNKRLIIPGTWFRLSGKKELMKYARVQVDIDSSSDSLWDIDVKKSTAVVPPIFREVLGRVLTVASDSSESLTKYRGKKENTPGIIPVWNRISDRDNSVRYEINDQHPQYVGFVDSLNPDQQRDFYRLMKSIEIGFPMITMYSDCSKGVAIEPEEDIENELFESGLQMINMGVDISLLRNTQPWSNYPDVLNKLGDYHE